MAKREQLLQMLVYEHYVRPHFDFFGLIRAERDLMDGLDREFGGDQPSVETTRLVRRWFDKSWRGAAREWAELRDGDGAVYVHRHPADSVDSAQLELPGAAPAQGPIAGVTTGVQTLGQREAPRKPPLT